VQSECPEPPSGLPGSNDEQRAIAAPLLPLRPQWGRDDVTAGWPEGRYIRAFSKDVLLGLWFCGSFLLS
jgi:hypothetical protein